MRKFLLFFLLGFSILGFSQNNLMKVGGFSTGKYSNFSIGFEKIFTPVFGAEVMANLRYDGVDNPLVIFAVQTGGKYYLTDLSRNGGIFKQAYISLFYRYERIDKNSYTTDNAGENSSGVFYEITGHGIGAGVGKLVKLADQVFIEVGGSAYYSVRNADEKFPNGDDRSILNSGFRMIPRLYFGIRFGREE